MDHDAMLTKVNQLMKFKADFLAMSKMTDAEFHAEADKARADKAAWDAEQAQVEASQASSDVSKPSDGTEPLADPNIAPVASAGPGNEVPVTDPAPAPVPGA